MAEELDVSVAGITTGGQPGEAIATPDVDYSIPSTITIPEGYADSEKIYIARIDDPDAEGIEAIRVKVQPDVAGRYLLATTVPTTTSRPMDDNVSVSVLEIGYRRLSLSLPQGSGPLPGDAGYSIDGYNFHTHIYVEGERLDKIRLRQLINASASIIDRESGSPISSAAIATRFPHTDAFSLANTYGQEVLDGYMESVGENQPKVFHPIDGINLNIWDHKKNGAGFLNDSHTFGLYGGTSPTAGRVYEIFKRDVAAKVQVWSDSDINKTVLKQVQWEYHFDNSSYAENVAGIGWVARYAHPGGNAGLLFTYNPIVGSGLVYYNSVLDIKNRLMDLSIDPDQR